MKNGDSILQNILEFYQNSSLNYTDYQVPNLWINPKSKGGIGSVDYRQFYIQKIEEILEYRKDINYGQSLSNLQNEHHGIGGDWSYHSVVYSSFPRFTTAFDHMGNGDLKEFKVQGVRFKKTGTLMKMIALLPYFKSMGINTLHVMPITQTSSNGVRGDLGSPYAIKNPYRIDDALSEPFLEHSVEDQFKALVEACHILNIRIVLEFVLRTASLDSDWIKTFPDRFYWINEENLNDYHSPEFTKDQLHDIKLVPQGNGVYHAPNPAYQNMFQKPPSPEEVYMEDGVYKAKTTRGTLVVPGAFADWPPDDKQPPWDDVTYLRMYDDSQLDENFNYIAYNTIRYYDPKLAQVEHRIEDLWDDLSNVIPHYQKEYGIDGVMLDMGHALPKPLLLDIIEKARNVDADFGFWEENFTITQSSRNSGFNAALGFEWKHKQLEGGIRNMVNCARKPFPLPFLGTAETHNTPRKKILAEKKQWYVLNNFLPSCIPCIHTGYELNEEHPVNTGLNFTSAELEFYRDFPLALFHSQALNWDVPPEMLQFIQDIALLRAKNHEWVATGDERTLTIHYPENPFGRVIAFERHDAFQPWKSILIILNTNISSKEQFFLELYGTYNNSYTDYLSDVTYTFEDHWLSAKLEPGQILIFEMHKLI